MALEGDVWDVYSLLIVEPVVSYRYYNWSTAAPVMLAMQVYQKPLPQVLIDIINISLIFFKYPSLLPHFICCIITV